MTIRDLLTHRSGMGSAKAICSSGPTPLPSRRNYLQAALHETRIQFPQPLRYDNLLY